MTTLPPAHSLSASPDDQAWLLEKNQGLLDKARSIEDGSDDRNRIVEDDNAEKELSPRSLRQHIPTLVGSLLLGLGSWIAVNGIFSELYVLTSEVPEGYDIYSWAAVAVSFGNLAAFFVFIIVKKVESVPIVYVISGVLIALGGITLVILAFTWDVYTYIAGQERSLGLLLCLFLAGCVDCSTTLVFYPAVQIFPRSHTSSLAIGESLTGAVSALLGIAQTSGMDYGQARFGPTVFFLFLFTVMALAGNGLLILSYYAKEYISAAKKKDIENESLSLSEDERELPIPSTSSLSRSILYADEFSELAKVTPRDGGSEVVSIQVQEEGQARCPELRDAMMNMYIPVYIAQFLLSFLENGLVAILVPFATDPYPNGTVLQKWAVYTMLITAPLGNAASHAGRANGVVYRRVASCSITVLLCFWILLASTWSPASGSATVGALVCTAFPLCKFVIAYAKTSEYFVVHKGGSLEGQRLFRNVGCSIQSGACIGSVLFFILTSVTGAIGG